MNRRNLIFQGIILIVLVIVESTLLSQIQFYGFTLKLSFVLFLFMSLGQGAFKAEIMGFAYGLVLDFLSLSPLGLNCFVHTFLGWLVGKLKGKFSMDPVFLPILFSAVATLLRYGLSILLLVIFVPDASPAWTLWQAMLINAILAPVLLGVLKATGMINLLEREER